MERTEHRVRAPDGRLLLVEASGPPDGDVVLFVHGTPGSRHLSDELIEAGAARGLRHLAVSRAGHEGSDRNLGRKVIDEAADLAAVVTRLAGGPVYLVSESGGGPPALAFAALYPELVRAVAIVSSPAPIDAEGLNWSAGMAPENLEEHALTTEAVRLGDDTKLERFVEALGAECASAGDGKQLGEGLGGLAGEADLTHLEEGSEHQRTCWKLIMKGGILGWVDDDKAACEEWGFDLGSVEARVTVWHGSEDQMVPFAHGKWLAKHLPNAKLREPPAEGHISIWRHYGAILDDLIASGP